MEEEQKLKLTVPGAIVVAGLIIGLAVIFTNNPIGDSGLARRSPAEQDGATNTQEQKQKDRVVLAENMRPVDETDHLLGNPNAKVILVEYSDFECPFCKRFHITMQTIMDEYGKDGRLAWVYRQFPIDSIHSKATTESEASECVAGLGGNDAFWQFTDRIFEITPSNNGLDLSILPQLAVEAGVKATDFEKCLNERRYKERVEADIDDGVAAGVTGTPYSVVINKNGDKFPINGAQPINTIRQVIEIALRESE